MRMMPFSGREIRSHADSGAATRGRSFKHVMKWTGWALLGATIFWCWMFLGVAVLAFINYFLIFLDPGRPEGTPAWIAYSELAGLTFVWPLVLMLLTSRARMLKGALLCWVAVMGVLSFAFGGWNVAGRQFDRPLDRALCGLLVLAAAALGGFGAQTKMKNRL
jgi:hypothetical protein